MRLATVARDCLYVHWLLPRALAPSLPAPLRYEVHAHGGAPYVFASAQWFQVDSLHASTMPLLRASYPQLNLRLYAFDDDGVPSVYFPRLLVPLWITPAARLLARQPLEAAHFRVPAPTPSVDPALDGASSMAPRRWLVRRAETLSLIAAPAVRGNFDRAVPWVDPTRHLRRRIRGYVPWGASGVRAIRTWHPSAASAPAQPMDVEMTCVDLLASTFGVDDSLWLHPHGACLCAEIPVAFDLMRLPRVAPAPAPTPTPAAASRTGASA
ncbi:MAG: DUF2071 domain-containing protein [Acidobacteriota bacterium]